MTTKYEIGYFDEGSEGPKWKVLKTAKREVDAQAEAEVDGLKKATPPTIDGSERLGLYIKRGTVKWFRRFSCHA